MTTNPAPAPTATFLVPASQPTAPTRTHGRRRRTLALGLHYVEMVLAMVAGMMLLDPVARALFGASAPPLRWRSPRSVPP